MNENYDDAFHRHGFWDPSKVKVSVDTCNDHIKWFLERVGSMTLRDLDTNSRLISIENRLKAQKTAQLDTATKIDNISDTITDIKAAPPGVPKATRQTRSMSRHKVVDNLASGNEQGKSPKRKKPEEGDGPNLLQISTGSQTEVARAQQTGAATAAATSSAEITKEPTWSEVVARKRKRKLIAGKHDVRDGASCLVGGSATTDIVVSGIRASLDAKEKLIDHLTRPFGKSDNGIAVEDVQQLTKDPKKKTLSFKVTIKTDDKKAVLTGQFWPPKTYVRNFIPGNKRKENP